INIAEGKEVKYGSTSIRFSHAVPHGADERLGYVVQVAINDKDSSLLVTSDIEGAPRQQHLEFTKEVKPNYIIIDGPLSYLLGRALSDEDLDNSLRNMEEIVKEGIEIAIIDHHVLRDLKYEEILKPVKDVARDFGVKIMTAAEFLGNEPIILEARRRELFQKENKPAKIPRGLAQLFKSSQGD
ncbi:MAG: hypothetical protein JZD40_06655, partial [Sulfolobus sp.]|nr:hypothetical protein [Sulfolobus sp.]